MKNINFKLAVFALMILIPLVPTEAVPIDVKHADNIDAFTLVVTGGDFDSDDAHTVGKGSFWKVTVNITEDAGFFNDLLSIRGTAQHMRGRHGEKANVHIFSFDFFIDADLYTQGSHSAADVTDIFDHELEAHFNNFVASLSFSISSSAGFDDIIGYTLKVTGTHCVTDDEQRLQQSFCPLAPEPVPEPHALLFFFGVPILTSLLKKAK